MGRRILTGSNGIQRDQDFATFVKVVRGLGQRLLGPKDPEQILRHPTGSSFCDACKSGAGPGPESTRVPIQTPLSATARMNFTSHTHFCVRYQWCIPARWQHHVSLVHFCFEATGSNSVLFLQSRVLPMSATRQELLRDAWLGGSKGHLSALSEARAWSHQCGKSD